LQTVERLVNVFVRNEEPAEFEKLDQCEIALEAAGAAVRVARDAVFNAGKFPTPKAFEDWMIEVATPSEADLHAEAAGKPAPGQAVYGVGESVDLTISDVLMGIPR
jgi:hypothetical protein